MKKREIMRSIFCGLAAGALFLALFLGIGWNFIVAVLLAGGLFLGLSLITKPKKIQGKIPLDMRPDAAYLKERLEEAKEDFGQYPQIYGKDPGSGNQGRIRETL